MSSLEDLFKQAHVEAKASADALNVETDKPSPDPGRVKTLQSRLDRAERSRDAALAALQAIRPAAPAFPERVAKKRKLEEVFVMKEQKMKAPLQIDDEDDDDNDEDEDDEDEEFAYFEIQEFPPMITRNESHRYVFIRKCYLDLYNHIGKFLRKSSPGRNLILSGNPGIGKSYFYLYCVIRLINDRFFESSNKALLLNSQSHYWKFDGVSFEEITYNYQVASDPNIIRLIDGDSEHLVGWSAISILFTSPKGENNPKFKSFLKNSAISFMPVWDLLELLNVNTLLISKNIGISDLHSRFELVGGVARYVLNDTKSLIQLEGELDQAIADSNGSRIIAFVKAKTPVSDSSSWLLKMVPIASSDGAERFYLDFLSNAIAEKVIETSEQKSLEDLKKFAIDNISDPNSGTFRGKIYEAFIHKMLKNNALKNKSKKARALSPDQQDIQIQFDICQSKQFVEIDKIDVHDTSIYYYPKSKTHRSIDGIYVTPDEVYLFQATISPSHPVNNAGLKNIVDTFVKTFEFAPDKVFLVFIVPNQVFQQGWTKEQRLVTSGKNPRPVARGKVQIHQYVVDIDWAEM